jgi:hypothetical protein
MLAGRFRSWGILEGTQAASTPSYTFQMQRTTLLEFHATLGEEPIVELALV